MTETFTLAAVEFTPARRDASESPIGRTTKFDDGNVTGSDNDYLIITGEDALEQRVRHRLITKRRSWALRPTYGGGLEDLVNKPDDPATAMEVERDIRDTLSYEPGIAKVLQVDIAFEDTDDGYAMRVVVEYESLNQEAGVLDLSFPRAG